ncbi:hypothetical protein B0H16DRAFT_1571394 [Mycena metata]|uniref:Uncharacterized protein n=1 Tax=Mycena metata TaxID=1033252 RepID=A0AAD7I9B7_9AGAR|nr:hypothetical protein B0H16DRAFT_1571394 [Mycena metata]
MATRPSELGFLLASYHHLLARALPALLPTSRVSLSRPQSPWRPIFSPVCYFVPQFLAGTYWIQYATDARQHSIAYYVMLSLSTLITFYFFPQRALWLSYAVADPSRWRARRCESNRRCIIWTLLSAVS